MRLNPALTIVALMTVVAPAAAQSPSVVIRVIEADTDEPLRGVFVKLDDGTGVRLGSALTDARGLVGFVGVPPGRYSVTTERIGHASASLDVTVPESGRADLEVGLDAVTLELQRTLLEAEGQCEVRPGDGRAVARVWDEVRKALEVVQWTAERGVYEYRTLRYSRNVEAGSGRVSDLETRRRDAYQRVPFEGRPVEDLLENGFIQDGDGRPGRETYFVPHAAVLLSDRFQDSHCMRLEVTSGGEASLMGLDFRPAGGRRVPGIAGTLWVDSAHLRLSHLEYAYVETGSDIPTHGIGGQVDFRALPDGTWMVTAWRVRTPWLALARHGGEDEVIYQHGYHDEGATVLTVRNPGGDVVWSSPPDARGWLVAKKETGEPIPEAVAARCREENDPEPPHGAILAGRVTEHASGVPLEGSSVRVEWDGGHVTAATGPYGGYSLCAVPRNEPLRISAEWLGRSTRQDTIRIGSGPTGLMHDLAIASGDRATLTGRVEGWSRGERIRQARVSLLPVGVGNAEPTVLLTDARGRFALPDARIGAYRVAVSSVGYATVVDTIEVRAARTADVRIRLPEEAIEIRGLLVEVEARLHRLEETGYYERRREGLGVHLDADQIRPRLPVPVVQLFDGIPRIQVASTAAQAGAREVLVIRNCLPAIYVDGGLVRRAQPFYRNPNPQANPGNLSASETSPLYLSDLVTAQQIAGIEIYRGPAEIPIQYGGTGAGEMGTECGVILVWTH